MSFTIIPSLSRARIVQETIREVISGVNSQCPMHSNIYPSHRRPGATDVSSDKDYAFHYSSTTIRFGPDVTREVGMDFQNRGVKKVLMFTDKNLVQLSPVQMALDSLTTSNISYEVFDDIYPEPSNESFERAIKFTKNGDFDAFLAVGGGSVMDTAKVANLFNTYRDAELLDFISPSIGKGRQIDKELQMLVCVPTTSGSGSEVTGVAVMSMKHLNMKCAIADRGLMPTLALVDPLHTVSMPKNVATFTGFDVLCNALETYTALPYNERTPRPANPIERPTHQGSNPISDMWCRKTLKMVKDYFKRSIRDPEDMTARSSMHLASLLGGFGVSNSGVHLCHAFSYPLSAQVKNYHSEGYPQQYPLIPHGLAVVMTSPEVFNFTSPGCPEKHQLAAEILGVNVKKEDSGRALSDILREYMSFAGICNGISELGYTKDDISSLVKGTLPQKRQLHISPSPVTENILTEIMEKSLTVY